MGLLDQLSGMMGGKNDEVLGAIMGAVGSEGGLRTLLGKAQELGLGDTVQSWIGKGENLSISPDHIQAVLGSDAVSQLAEKLGIDSSAAADRLSALLPQAIAC